MKRMGLAASLFLAALSVGGKTPALHLNLKEPPPLDVKEPISLSLKDASIVDVITMLGELAKVPVLIAPDVQGTVSVELVDVPFEKVLQILGQQNGLSLRIEGGRLVVSSAKSGSTTRSLSAPVGDRVLSGMRLPVDEYAKASGRSWPAFVRVQTSSGSRCTALDFEKGASFEIPVPGLETPAVVSELAVDPVSRTRFGVVEFPSMANGGFALREAAERTWEVHNEDGILRWTILPGPKGGEICADARPSRNAGIPRTLRFEARETHLDGSTVLLSAPQLSMMPGSTTSATGSLGDSSGQHRVIRISAYLSVDGKSAAGMMMATAIWTDPADGREYVYSQDPSSALRFVSLSEEPVVLATLPVGSALDNPVELTVRLAPTPAQK